MTDFHDDALASISRRRWYSFQTFLRIVRDVSSAERALVDAYKHDNAFPGWSARATWGEICEYVEAHHRAALESLWWRYVEHEATIRARFPV